MKQECTLILITNHFPFGPYESFLEAEVPYLTGAFERVIIMARDVTSKGKRDIPGVLIHRINPVSGWREKLLLPFLIARHAGKIINYIKSELKWIKQRNIPRSSYITRHMAHTLVKALITAHHIRRVVKSENVSGHITLYAYWLASSALAITFVDNANRVKKISRAHGGDIYESRSKEKYLPFRSVLGKTLNGIYTISSDGRDHLSKQLDPEDSAKVKVFRLGTKTAVRGDLQKSYAYTIVSCSFMVLVKRIDLLIEALATMELPIHWVHIGDGPLADHIKSLAVQRLSPKQHIKFSFLGTLTSDALYKFYETQYVDVFINTSSSEGIPVSMMEAQSFGIPTVGPNVGGVPEIVVEGCGALFPVDASPQSIASVIDGVLTMPADSVRAMRNAAFENWNKHYNAANNFSTFVAEISKIEP